MKRNILILALLASVCCYAQEKAPQATEAVEATEALEAYCWGYLPGYPYYFCECKNTSRKFTYPLETNITDTMWFEAKVNDMKQGLSAYWFSDCSITFEVYAFCSSKTPTIRMTVGNDQMREMDITTINRKLDEMGEMAELVSQVLTPRVRVYPNGGTGKVYCYPYDQGPVSTCDNALKVVPRMTYVCDQPDEVYELKPEDISSNGQGFIQWKQKTNQSCTVWLTEGSCTGTELQRAVLSDSLRVMLLDAQKLKTAKLAGSSVYVHVNHANDMVGRIYYHNRIRWTEQRIDTALCQGKGLQLQDTTLYEATVYPNDTLWRAGDTLSIVTYHLAIDTPVAQYDTLRLKAAQLPTTYRNQYIAKDAWGDYDFTIRQTNKCDERWMVHVAHDYTTQTIEKHDTLCLGKTVNYSGVTYSTDTVIRDSAWLDADTWTIRDITIHFTEPELEYDTITIAPSKIGTNGYWYGTLGVAVKAFGDTLIVKTKKNQCTRWIQLTVLEGEEIPVTTDIELPSSQAEVYKYMRDGIIYIRREGTDYDLFGRPLSR